MKNGIRLHTPHLSAAAQKIEKKGTVINKEVYINKMSQFSVLAGLFDQLKLNFYYRNLNTGLLFMF